MKRLTKSNDKKIAGVCGGIAKFFGVDPTIIRLLAVVLVFCGIGAGLVVYIIAAIILPEPDSSEAENIENLKSANVDDYKSEQSQPSSNGGHTDEEFDSYFDKK